jgi:predicted nucleotidyltransferase
MGASALLRSALADLQTRIGVAFIYGSLAAKTHDAKSDIDVFIVGDVRTRDVMARIDPLEQSLRREVNPSVMSPAEFRTRLANEDPFVCDVVLGPRLYLVGGDHELGDLAGRTIGETPQHKPTRD